MTHKINPQIALPSGLVGVMRGFTVKEINLLTSRRRNTNHMKTILGNCWEETIAPGPYKDMGEKPDWDKVLQGDRNYAFLAARMLTYGPLYEIQVKCENCGIRYPWDVSLDELPLQKLSDDDRVLFEKGNVFKTELPQSGKQVEYRLLLGEDEEKIQKQVTARRGDDYGIFLGQHIVKIDGVNYRPNMIDDMSMGDAEFLRAEIEDHNCGIETEIETYCPECSHSQELELPFGPQFLLTSKRKRR